MEKIKIVINGDSWDNSIYKTLEWEQSVVIKKWTHDFELNIYIIEYEEKEKLNK